MGKPLIAAIMLWCVVCSAWAAEVFSLRIDAYPAVAPRGCPIEITAEIRNVSGHAVATGLDILASGGYGLPDAGGRFSLIAKVQDATGSSVAPCPHEFSDDYYVVGPETPTVLPADWRLRFQAPLCVDQVGSYKVKFVAREQGPFIDRLTKKEFEIWSGEVDSQEVTISIVEPTGVDREAYDRFEGQPMRAPELLREFPTSTYAAYAIRGFTSEGLSRSENAAIADSLKNGAAGISRCIPCPPSVSPCVQPGNLETRGTKALDWTAEWIDLVLKAHSDLWFADELRLRLALDEIASGKSSLGASDLGNLSKTGRPEIAEKAGQLLLLVRQRSLVK